jgi:hypothetical protein
MPVFCWSLAEDETGIFCFYPSSVIVDILELRNIPTEIHEKDTEGRILFWCQLWHSWNPDLRRRITLIKYHQKNQHYG